LDIFSSFSTNDNTRKGNSRDDDDDDDDDDGKDQGR
jgi:hypothetical protein